VCSSDLVSFKWKDTNENAIGVIAQEVEQVLPEVVATAENGDKSVAYGNIVAVLIEAVKEQQKEIEMLKQRLGF
jgi:translation initiation factor IF-2